jgi:hypothetical protein
MSECTWGRSGPAPAAIMIGAIGASRTGVEIITNVTIDDSAFGAVGPVMDGAPRSILFVAIGNEATAVEVNNVAAVSITLNFKRTH